MNADLAIANEIMRERAKLEQQLIDGLKALVDQHKLQPEEANGQYSKVILTALEQEIEARTDLKPDIPDRPPVKEFRRFH